MARFGPLWFYRFVGTPGLIMPGSAGCWHLLRSAAEDAVGRPSSQSHGHFAAIPPRRPHRDFNVLTEVGEKLKQTAHRKASGTVAHERGNMRLPDTERGRSLALRQTSLFDDAVDLKRQTRFDQLLFRVGQSKIGEDIAAAPGDPRSGFRSLRSRLLGYTQFCLPLWSRSASASLCRTRSIGVTISMTLRPPHPCKRLRG